MKIEDIIKSNVTLEDTKKVILNLFYTQSVIGDKFNEILKPFEISPEQYNVLRILRGQNGVPANRSIIQERMLTKNSNTTRLIDKLILKKLVSRKNCPENRRKIEVLITTLGIDLLAVLDPKVDDYDSHFAKNLNPEELMQLNYLLEKYRNVSL